MNTIENFAEEFHMLNKKSSDKFKEHLLLEDKTRQSFIKLIEQLCKKYNLKVRYSPYHIDLSSIDEKYTVQCGESEKYNYTRYNEDFQGEFDIILVGNLNDSEMDEIFKVTKNQKLKKEDDENGFCSYYILSFDFYEEYGVDYQ